jgi:hypothetical protein
MKKALLGTTALVAAGLTVGGAQAQEGVKLAIGGFYRGAAGVLFVDDFDGGLYDDEDTRDYVFKQDVEVHFTGSAILDNGLEVGARVELEGQTSTDQIDRVYAWFSGGFGEIRFGDFGDAYSTLCYLVPSAAAIFGADSPVFNFSNAGIAGYNATNGTCYGLDDNSTKIAYFSPNFGGFSFAVSFTPDGTEDSRNTLQGAGTRFDNNFGQNSENLSVAAQFAHDFNGVNLVIGGGGAWSFDREGDGNLLADEREDYNLYAQVGFSGFTIGGAAAFRNNVTANGNDSLVYGGGVTYNWDAWTVGFGYTHGTYDFAPGVKGVSPSVIGQFTAVLTNDITDDYNVYSLTASYALGPGIQIDGVLEYYEYQGDEDGGDPTFADRDYEGFAFGLGTLINF